jgi:Delta24-sterol reductase
MKINQTYPSSDINDHNLEVLRISKEIKTCFESGRNEKLRFFHGGTNSTRPKDKSYKLIDISSLNNVVEINIEEKFALVEPSVSMEQLVSATLEKGLLPLVVMEFPAITCGGAVNGASLESSSYKHGQLSDTCEEYEVILGNGELVKASRNENPDLFYGISGSYGTLGLVTLLKVNLVTASEFVHTTFYPTTSFQETLDLIKEKIADKEIDYLDAIVFSPLHGVVMTGKRTNEKSSEPVSFSKVKDPWFYEYARDLSKNIEVKDKLINITEYLFRYNRGAFWMVEFAFPLLGIPKNKLTRFIFNPVSKTKELFEALHTLNVSQDFFLQDFYFPLSETLNCLEYNESEVKVYPLWLCPIRSTKTTQKLSPHYINEEMLIDVGIWGQTKDYLSDPIKRNKDFETFAEKHNARKMLYAHAYYSKDEFWNIYDKGWYETLRKKYNASEVFPDVWQKTHVPGQLIGSRWKGFFKFFIVNPIKKRVSKIGILYANKSKRVT